MRRTVLTSVMARRGLVSEKRTAARLMESMSKAVARRLSTLPALSFGIGGTALAAAILFIAYDCSRTLGDMPTLWALVPRFNREPVIDGLWQRGAIVLALALLTAIVATSRPFARRVAGETRRAINEVVGTIPFGVAVWSDDGHLLASNEAYTDRLNEHGDPLPNARYGEAIKRLTEGAVVEIVRDGDRRRLMELRLEDGRCLLLDERPLATGGFITVITDITENRQTGRLLSAARDEQRLLARQYHEEKLKAEAASRAKTSFLAHLSHDIRTPLNHIIGFAELIRQQTYGPLGDARYLTYVDTIRGSGEKLLASFATILELAELEGGNKPLHEEEFPADDLLAGVRRRYSAQAGRAGLTFIMGVASGGELFADRFCLERMLGNLVENALRFTPSGGTVRLAAYAADDGIVLEVSDTGIGMSEDQLSRLSQSFVLGDAAFTREHDGAGLGIAIARAIAELSGGNIAIESSPALGTTVAISLPDRRARLEANAA
jgi:two-component system cell cycle sensor histidine kinase PleC